MDYPLYTPGKKVIFGQIPGKVINIGYVYDIQDDAGVVHKHILENVLSLPISPLVLSGKLTQEEFEHRKKALNTKYSHRSCIRDWFKAKYPISSEAAPRSIARIRNPYEWIPFGTKERIIRYYQDNPSKISNFDNERFPPELDISLDEIKGKIHMPLVEIPKNKSPIYEVGDYVRCVKSCSTGTITEINVNDDEHQYIINIDGKYDEAYPDNNNRNLEYARKKTFDEYYLEPFNVELFRSLI